MVQSDGVFGIGRVEGGRLHIDYTNAQGNGFGTIDIGPETTPAALVESWTWQGSAPQRSWQYVRQRTTTDDAAFADGAKFRVRAGTKRPLRGGAR
jgi:hypothetical protein